MVRKECFHNPQAHELGTCGYKRHGGLAVKLQTQRTMHISNQSLSLAPL